METMNTVVGSLRTLLVKTRTFRAYADVAAFFVLITSWMALCSPGSRPGVGPETGNWIGFATLATGPLLLIKAFCVEDAPSSLTTRTLIQRGILSSVVATICGIIVLPFAALFGTVWAVLWSVFTGHLLLSGVTSFVSFSRVKMKGRSVEFEKRLVELREALAAAAE